MSPVAIAWDADPGAGRVVGDPVLSVDIDRATWEAHGAAFSEIDDGNGSRIGLATALLSTTEGDVALGLQDYGLAETFVLFAAEVEQDATRMGSALRALEGLGLVHDEQIISSTVSLGQPVKPSPVEPQQRTVEAAEAVQAVVDAAVTDTRTGQHRSGKGKGKGKNRGKGRGRLKKSFELVRGDEITVVGESSRNARWSSISKQVVAEKVARETAVTKTTALAYVRNRWSEVVGELGQHDDVEITADDRVRVVGVGYPARLREAVDVVEQSGVGTGGRPSAGR